MKLEDLSERFGPWSGDPVSIEFEVRVGEEIEGVGVEEDRRRRRVEERVERSEDGVGVGVGGGVDVGG